MKQAQPVEKIIESLIILRNEMVALGYPEFAFKINSCIVGDYSSASNSIVQRQKYAFENWYVKLENDEQENFGAFA